MKSPAKMTQVFGFMVPTEDYYFHRGHGWVVLEKPDRVRVGLDDFSQKILGPAEALQPPEPGRVYYQDHIFMALLRQGHKASFVAPVDGTVVEVNEKARKNPRLIHDDPYGEGWLYLMQPSNLKHNLENLVTGPDTVAWLEEETHRLLEMLTDKAGYTLPSGGSIVDDVYGHFPVLGWRRLVRGFFTRHLQAPSSRRGFEGWDRWDKRTWRAGQ